MKDNTEFEAYYFDEDSPNFSRVHIHGEPRFVYTGKFRKNVFDGGGVYQFGETHNGHKCSLHNNLGVWQVAGGLGQNPSLILLGEVQSSVESRLMT